ncbi:cytochrome c oxidase assembly factor 4 homolog, mitochondrial [Neodiprion virginianus]|uniref:cytochrome c oxidase assembly factor 4 homolog, mitochondrial n=1 Tax=Neodiprion fabricii TaxID=2872261 RepID=UPI001ED91060|nr:cytochrome c oxidase assembly factor 4 homolog, mitochondrial [Neodiprion fabricii]XP_046620345.1 cytochrome c oxidase assembly factor 4 homolog, mitochondrial [Neodiprion virginianus]
MTVYDNEKSLAEDTEDPVDRMLKKTGCIELHYKVQDCIAETQDWRKCQEPVKQFKNCMSNYEKKRREKNVA